VVSVRENIRLSISYLFMSFCNHRPCLLSPSVFPYLRHLRQGRALPIGLHIQMIKHARIGSSSPHARKFFLQRRQGPFHLGF
jgi:hypothetical protein